MKYFALLISLLFLLCATVASSKTTEGDASSQSDTSPESQIGITEKLGEFIPMDITLTDEQGNPVRLGDLVNKPTVISLVYYSCRQMCPLLLAGEAEVVRKSELVAGKDFRLISISFDENDTPSTALEAKGNYLSAVGDGFPADEWRFLTADKEAISNITASVGFKFRRSKIGFSHPAALIIVSPEGKITRYLYGVRFLPFDLKLALSEAAEGKIGSTARSVLLYCFSYDPEGKRYVFNILRVVGTLTVAFMVIFFIYLVISTRRKRRKTQDDNKE